MKKSFFIFFVGLIFTLPVQAFWDITGPTQVAYLSKILIENQRRFQQLRGMMQNAHHHQEYIRLINQGLDNATDLLQILPVEDEKIFSELQNFKQATMAINQLYGIVPISKDSFMHQVHDQSVAESLKMINKSRIYAKKQEGNAIRVFHEGASSSPKGAVRMTAQISSQILHTLNQILKVNGQILKIASTSLAYQNKIGKTSVNNFKKLNSDIKNSFSGFNGQLSMPRF